MSPSMRRSVPVDGRDLNGLLAFDEGPDLFVGHCDFVSALGHVRLLAAYAAHARGACDSATARASDAEG